MSTTRKVRRGRRPKAKDQPIRTLFPSFSLREASILLQCVSFGMSEGVLVDGEFVSTDEWKAIIKQLLRH